MAQIFPLCSLQATAIADLFGSTDSRISRTVGIDTPNPGTAKKPTRLTGKYSITYKTCLLGKVNENDMTFGRTHHSHHLHHHANHHWHEGSVLAFVMRKLEATT